MVVAAEPPEGQLLTPVFDSALAHLQFQQEGEHLGIHCYLAPFGRLRQLPFARVGRGEKLHCQL
jgi:hypothetical protein